jgi:hypothetical protein
MKIKINDINFEAKLAITRREEKGMMNRGV